jgi:Protein of unknown function (DUF1203)
MTSFQIIPIETAVAERIRRDRVDELGRPVVARVADSGGYPCRHCLEDAVPGETMLLFGHSPFTTGGPYREVGPIYVHERPCARRAPSGQVPEQLRRRLLALRGYDAAGNMVAADVVDGREMEGLLGKLLARDDVAFVHARNARPGCFACAIVRA